MKTSRSYWSMVGAIVLCAVMKEENQFTQVISPDYFCFCEDPRPLLHCQGNIELQVTGRLFPVLSLSLVIVHLLYRNVNLEEASGISNEMSSNGWNLEEAGP